MSDQRTWREAIAYEMKEAQDPGPIVATTLTNAEFDETFDAGYGGTNGKPFTAWSPTRVYFPVCYDGAEWVGSVPRNPCDQRTRHVGG